MLSNRLVQNLLSLLLLAAVAAAPLVAGEHRVTPAAEVGMSAERLERIAPAMQAYVDDGKVPGVVTLVARRGEVVHFNAVGRQHVETDEAMTLDTIFRLYSQSKPVTGVAVMILYEEGRFLLTDPVAKYLPEFSEMRVYVGEKDGSIETEPAAPITIQHLLTHTSGLTYDFFGSPVAKLYAEAGATGAAPTSPHGSLEEWTKALAKQPLVAQPGTAWNYSVGMDVLGRLVEVTSGQSFGDFLQQRIFAPLGMVDTGFHVPDDKLARFAANYAPTPAGGMIRIEEPQTSPYRQPAKIEMGGSGLVGTVGDYLLFAQMLANDGKLGGVRILAPSTVDLMMSNHLHPEMPPDPLTSLFGGGSPLSTANRAWGLGFGLTGFVATEPALTGIPMSKGTFSWGGAATTHFWVDRKQHLVGLVLTQLLPDGTYPLRQLMQQLTYQAIIE